MIILHWCCLFALDEWPILCDFSEGDLLIKVGCCLHQILHISVYIYSIWFIF
jgi:hypothetical protein